MIRGSLLSLVGVVLLGSWTFAQGPAAGRLQLRPGQVLLYHVEHTTTNYDKLGDSESETKSLLKVTKRWDVLSVDGLGIATLKLSLTSMLHERTTPSGEVLRFDSANTDKSTPQLKEAMSRFLNTPLATIRVDPFGRVVEVKESKAGAANFDNELPFLALLPGILPKPGQSWDRAYKITLAPPLGTGEKYDAVQHYTCKNIAGDQMTLTLASELKSPPKAAADAIPLWQMLPQGEVTFDLKAGRLHSAKLTIQKELKDHQGEGSLTKFQSTLTLSWAGEK
jgi:hypothetical protein